MRPYINMTDQEVIDEITSYLAAKKTLIQGGGIAVIQGERRRLEFTPASSRQIDETLRLLEYEARQRGLEIAGDGGAIGVEFR